MFEFEKKFKFINQRITRVIASPFQKIICAFGPKFLSILDYNLNEHGKIRDEDPHEIIMCVLFLRIKQDYNIKNIDWKSQYPESKSERFSYLIALAGELGAIKIIDLYVPTAQMILKGHGSRIIDLISHPKHEHLILSSSADTTIRMWNLKIQKTVVIFGGLCGHEDMVLCLDISEDGHWLVSGGSDNCIKVWEIPNGAHNDIENIPKRIHFPVYSSQVLHKTYINYIKFYGQIILSKNISNRISIFIFEEMFKDEAKKSLSEQNLFFKDTLKKHVRNSEINGKFIYKNSINSNTIVMNDYKFNDKLIHKFAVYKNLLIVFETSGYCYTLDLNTFQKKAVQKRVENINDVAIIGNNMFLTIGGDTIEYFTIMKM